MILFHRAMGHEGAKIFFKKRELDAISEEDTLAPRVSGRFGAERTITQRAFS
jgi:hypothetical protein